MRRSVPAGSRQDYLPIQQATDIDEDLAGRPQNRQQTSFETDRSPVRVLRGRPGSGKTTVLWRGHRKRARASTSSTSPGRRGCNAAPRNGLAAFAPSTSRVRATDFRALTGEITGADVRWIPPAESRRRLGHAIEQAVGHERHPWKGHEAAVYAEVRGRLLGRGLDGEADSDDGAKMAALRSDAYRRQRGNEQGIGAATAKTLLPAPAVVGEGAREHPHGDIPRAGGRRGRRAPAFQQGAAGGDGVRPSRRRRGAGPDPDRVLDAA